MGDNEFTESVSGTGIDGSTDLPGAYPGLAANKNKAASKKWRCKYAKFSLNEDGNALLEEIMDAVLKGENQLIQEKWSNSKDGDVFVTIKYLVPAESLSPKDEVKGSRRQRKALLQAKENTP